MCSSAKVREQTESEILIALRQCQPSSCVCGLGCHGLKGSSPFLSADLPTMSNISPDYECFGPFMDVQIFAVQGTEICLSLIR